MYIKTSCKTLSLIFHSKTLMVGVNFEHASSSSFSLVAHKILEKYVNVR